MNRFGIIMLFLCLSLCSLGCTFGSGGLNLESTQVQLKEKNFRVVKTVRAEDSGFRFCGIGGVASYADAMDKLRSSAGLTVGGPLALVNLTADTKTRAWFGPAVITETLVISADVVEFESGPGGSVATTKK